MAVGEGEGTLVMVSECVGGQGVVYYCEGHPLSDRLHGGMGEGVLKIKG